jgi:hypothetical protein
LIICPSFVRGLACGLVRREISLVWMVVPVSHRLGHAACGAGPSARAAAAASQANEPGARCHWAISPYTRAVNASSSDAVPAAAAVFREPALTRG